MPENTVKVDRSTKWGNPFKVGEDGTAADCVEFYRVMLSGGVFVTTSCSPELQVKSCAVVQACIHELHGKNLACRCRRGKPCHADVLLELANQDHFSDARKMVEGGD